MSEVIPQSQSFRTGMCRHTASAVELFAGGKPGDTQTRDQLAAVIGRSVELNSLGYGNVLSAINHVERLKGVVWRWDRSSQVFRCLDSRQSLADSQQSLRRSVRAAKRSLRTASTIKVEELTDEERSQYRATSVQAELIRLTGGGDVHKRIAAAGEVKSVDVKKLMSVFV